MANTQIPNLPAAISLSGAEQIEIVQAGTSRRATTQQVADLNTNIPAFTNIQTFTKIGRAHV